LIGQLKRPELGAKNNAAEDKFENNY